jgi:uncharacterized repeat protein (TIGR03803 family)
MSKFNWWMRACGAFLLWATAVVALPAQTLTTLHSFDYTDGYHPLAGLVQATNGNLYGTTPAGGANGYGTIFTITRGGTLTTLYNFCPQPQNGCTDGAQPAPGLIQSPNGNFYGTTSQGGATDAAFGTVFKITPGGNLTTLYSFCSQRHCKDGAEPLAGLVQGTNGDFYGTTNLGGAIGHGTVFKITPSGKLTTLHSFDGTDGYGSYANMIQGTDGNFYGATVEGGTHDNCWDFMGEGCGTVFKITPSGELTTIYSFCSQYNQNVCTDGAHPSGLVQGTDGTFHGVTGIGGANGYGTVFQITSSSMLTNIYSFCPQSGCADGSYPSAELVQATDGNFYGVTAHGGANNSCSLGCGTIFKITPGGKLTTLFIFDGADGATPSSGLIQGTNGKFYGTTQDGGAINDGTVYRLSLGLK